MKSYAMTLNLKDDPEIIEKYKRHHRAVWPEVLEGLRRIRINKMKIFFAWAQVVHVSGSLR